MKLSLRLFLILVLLAGLIPAQDNVRPLTILHTNDLHARLLPDADGSGGFAYLATAIRREKAGCGSCLVLNAGDLVQGGPVSTIFRGIAEYEIGNLFGFDVSTLGNHEFDYGAGMISRYLRTARYPVVTSNVEDGGGRLLTGRAYVIRNVNGIRVAVIGADLSTLADFSTPDKMGPWRATPAIEAVRKYSAEVRGRSDLIVVLGHLLPNEAAEILRQVPAVAVLVTGHPHFGLKAAEEYQGRVHVELKGYGRELGRLDLQVDVPGKKLVSWNWKRIPIDSKSLPPAGDVAAAVAKWEGRVSKTVDVPIGEAKRDMLQPEVKVLIERAMMGRTGADFAFMNAGGVRDKLPRGRLLARHVWNVMPFDNKVVIGKFKGSELPERIRNGRAIDPKRDYTFAVSDFTAANQKTQLGTVGLAFSADGPLLRDVIIDWIKQRKVLE